MSIVKPKFSNPTGGGALFLSIDSDLNGVCKLYGLSSYVENSIIDYDAHDGYSVHIDSASRFSVFVSNYSHYSIDSLICR